MTLLSVAQAVAKKVGISVPDSLASSTTREHVELLETINEMAQRIAEVHNWEVLNVQETITGDGTTESHNLPSDYDRMLVKSQLWSSSLETPLSQIFDRDEWLGLDVQSYDYVINAWIKYGGQIHIKPALASGVTAKYFYTSNLIVSPNTGSNKTEFTADDDTFRLDERLLKLGTIWQWRENKGLPYAEDMATFETTKSRLINQDKGSRLLRVGRVRYPRDTEIAYPQAINS
jgi:hypothetical protein